MNRFWKLVVFFVLADFVALNIYVLANYGLGDIVDLITANAVTVLAAVDLVIALSIGSGFVIRDALARGKNPWGYVALTATTGSIGLLAYLLRRPAEA